MNVFGLFAKLTLDTSDFEKQVNDASKSFDKLGGAADEIGLGFGSFTARKCGGYACSVPRVGRCGENEKCRGRGRNEQNCEDQ